MGGHPLIDFCNTYIEHSDRVEDKIDSTKAAEECLEELFRIKTQLSRAGLLQLRQLRQTMRFYFEAGLQKKNDKTQIDRLNKQLSKISLVLKVKPDFSVTMVSEKKELLFRQGIMEQFYRLNLSLDRKRIKKCENPHCSHLFFDDSKNQSRRWCSMRSCGNIMKARRFYDRLRKKS